MAALAQEQLESPGRGSSALKEEHGQSGEQEETEAVQSFWGRVAVVCLRAWGL